MTSTAPVAGRDGDAIPTRDRTRRAPAAHEVARAVVTSAPIDPAEHADLVARASAGAVVTFSGVVRDHDLGRAVTWIEYVAHPSAAQLVAEVAGDVAGRCDIDALAVSHRVGTLQVGDCALAVAVAAAHRAEAFEAAALLVDEIKHRLPVWKRQAFPDGTDEWVDCP